MKKILLLCALLTILLIVSVVCSGCSSNKIEGTYYRLDSTWAGDYDEPALRCDGGKFEFDSDGNVRCYENEDHSYPGTYEYADGKITIYIEDGDGTTLSGKEEEKYRPSKDNDYYNYETKSTVDFEKIEFPNETKVDVDPDGYDSFVIDDDRYIKVE